VPVVWQALAVIIGAWPESRDRLQRQIPVPRAGALQPAHRRPGVGAVPEHEGRHQRVVRGVIGVRQVPQRERRPSLGREAALVRVCTLGGAAEPAVPVVGVCLGPATPRAPNMPPSSEAAWLYTVGPDPRLRPDIWLAASRHYMRWTRSPPARQKHLRMSTEGRAVARPRRGGGAASMCGGTVHELRERRGEAWAGALRAQG